jgi:hypothetical protein|tara:strand:+ start:4914 stop:5117 length:204 start_codon:yes stop_codon:yes gene_type:complete
MIQYFTEHPNLHNMTYIEHLLFSSYLGIQFLIAATCAFIHAIFPFLFETTSTDYANLITNIIDQKNR